MRTAEIILVSERLVFSEGPASSEGPFLGKPRLQPLHNAARAVPHEGLDGPEPSLRQPVAKFTPGKTRFSSPSLFSPSP
jgi:hypothetical protein